jgi:putative SOS response-associated peptidase YedK
MCYSNSSTSKNIDLANRYKKAIDSIPEQPPIYFASAFTFPYWRIVTKENDVQLMQWGLVPTWFTGANELEIAKTTFNARIETLSEKASFKLLVNSSRCIIPSTGFFEWKHENKQKIPHFIYPTNDSVFSMAGLFDSWMNPNSKEVLNSFTIITSEANDFMAEIHNRKKRMPLILNANDEESWLNGENEIKDFQLKSNPDLDAHPVDSRILLGSNPNVYEAQLKFELKNLQQTMF